MILRPDRELTVVNFFAGIGGCALGMKWAGFKSLGSFDLDEKALRDLQRDVDHIAMDLRELRAQNKCMEVP